MNTKSSAHYQREYRKRLREQGLVKKEVWVLPQNSKMLSSFEKQLRKPQTLEYTGENNMSESATHRWNTESLFMALKDRPSFSDGTSTIEIIDGIDSSIVITMHDYGDLPVFVTAGGDQILAEAILFDMADVTDTAKFNEYVLRMHKYLPLSNISIESDGEHGDFYHMFGALSASSSLNSIVHEIDTLADNVIQATEAFKAFLS